MNNLDYLFSYDSVTKSSSRDILVVEVSRLLRGRRFFFAASNGRGELSIFRCWIHIKNGYPREASGMHLIIYMTVDATTTYFAHGKG